MMKNIDKKIEYAKNYYKKKKELLINMEKLYKDLF
jgi:hypothetical protein